MWLMSKGRNQAASYLLLPRNDFMGYAQHFLLSLAVTGVTTLLLGIFVLAQDKKNKLFLTFSLYSLSISWWCLLQIGNVYGPTPKISAFFAKYQHIGVVFIPTFFLHFVYQLLSVGKRRYVLYLSYLTSFFFLLFVPTNILSPGSERKVNDQIYFGEPGPIYPFVIAFFVLCTIYGLVLVYRGINESAGLRKKQLQILFWSSLLGYLGGSANFILVYDISVYPLNPFGTYLVAGYVAATFYAIFKHKFLGIEVIIKKTLIFAGLFAFMYATFTVITFLGKQLLEDTIGWDQKLALIPAIVIIIFIHGPLKAFLVNVTDKYLFQKKYNPLQMIHDFSQAVLTELDLNKITKQTVDILSEALRIKSCGILVPNKEGDKFLLKESRGIDNKEVFIDDKSSLISKIGTSSIVADQTDEMKQLSAVICIGILIRKNLIGILALGRKKSDEDYTSNDIEVLNILSDALGVAITNAVAYEELRHKANLVTIGTLASGIKHDISKPIDHMNAEASNILARLKKREYKDLAQMLDETGNIIEKCCETFRTVISISEKYASRPKESEKRVVLNVAEELDTALSVVQHRINKSEIKVRRQIPDNLPRINFDRDYLRQILDNLLGNAIDAIEAAKRSKDDAVISIRASEVANRTLNVRLEISDTGTGVPEKIKDKIFKSWFTTKGEKGTGLGLALVSELVMRGGGTVELESQEGKGATFILGFKGVR